MGGTLGRRCSLVARDDAGEEYVGEISREMKRQGAKSERNEGCGEEDRHEETGHELEGQQERLWGLWSFHFDHELYCEEILAVWGVCIIQFIVMVEIAALAQHSTLVYCEIFTAIFCTF